MIDYVDLIKQNEEYEKLHKHIFSLNNRLDELETELAEAKKQIEAMKCCENCKHSTAPTMSEHIKHCRPCQNSEERFPNWELKKIAARKEVKK